MNEYRTRLAERARMPSLTRDREYSSNNWKHRPCLRRCEVVGFRAHDARAVVEIRDQRTRRSGARRSVPWRPSPPNDMFKLGFLERKRRRKTGRHRDPVCAQYDCLVCGAE